MQIVTGFDETKAVAGFKETATMTDPDETASVADAGKQPTAKRAPLVFFTVAFCAFSAAVLITTLSKNNVTASFFENRALEKTPVFSRDSFLSGEYFEDWENWFTDHVAGRETILKASTWFELELLHKPAVNDVVVQDDILLGFNKYGHWDTSYLETESIRMAEKFRAFSDFVEESGGVFYFVGLPDQYSYFNHLYPDYMENREWVLDPMHECFTKVMREYGVNYIDMRSVYDELGRPMEFYSLTDHHYSFYGALTAYQVLLGRINEDTGMGLKILTSDDMQIKELPNPYLGSRNRKLHGLRYMQEHAAYYVLNDPIPYSRWDNGRQTDAPIFNMPGSDTAIISYGFYMGQDYAETIIRTYRDELPNALIFGESFTNAMETLLYTAFNETRSLDMRHYSEKTLRQYVEEYRPDVVICIRDDTAFFTKTGNGAVD